MACIDESNIHYDWKAAKMTFNVVYINLGNISDVIEKTVSWFDVHCMWHLCLALALGQDIMIAAMDNYAMSMAILVDCQDGVICCFSSRIGAFEPYIACMDECNMHRNWQAATKMSHTVIFINLAQPFRCHGWKRYDVLSGCPSSKIDIEFCPTHKLCEATMQLIKDGTVSLT